MGCPFIVYVCVVLRILAGQIFYFLKRTQMTSELLLWCRGKEMLLNTKQMHSNKPWCGGKLLKAHQISMGKKSCSISILLWIGSYVRNERMPHCLIDLQRGEFKDTMRVKVQKSKRLWSV